MARRFRRSAGSAGDKGDDRAAQVTEETGVLEEAAMRSVQSVDRSEIVTVVSIEPSGNSARQIVEPILLVDPAHDRTGASVDCLHEPSLRVTADIGSAALDRLPLAALPSAWS